MFSSFKVVESLPGISLLNMQQSLCRDDRYRHGSDDLSRSIDHLAAFGRRSGRTSLTAMRHASRSFGGRGETLSD